MPILRFPSQTNGRIRLNYSDPAKLLGSGLIIRIRIRKTDRCTRVVRTEEGDVFPQEHQL